MRDTGSLARLNRLRPYPAYLPDVDVPGAIRLETTVRDLANPVAAVWHPGTRDMILSVNFPDGRPYNFLRISDDGNVAPFSSLAGLTGAVELAAVPPPPSGMAGPTRFATGDLFATTEGDGRILRISGDGRRINHSWAVVPDSDRSAAPLVLHIDATGAWDGLMIAAGGDGRIWRIDGAGTGTLVTDLGVRVSGLLTVPDDPQQYGELAGKLLAGSPDEGRLHVVDRDGAARAWSLIDEFGTRIDPEDILRIPAGEDFYGLDFTAGTLTRAAADAFAGYAGDILLSDRMLSADAGGLYRLCWDFATLRPTAERIALSGDIPNEWEAIVFAPIEIAGAAARSRTTQ